MRRHVAFVDVSDFTLTLRYERRYGVSFFEEHGFASLLKDRRFPFDCVAVLLCETIECFQISLGVVRTRPQRLQLITHALQAWIKILIDILLPLRSAKVFGI